MTLWLDAETGALQRLLVTLTRRQFDVVRVAAALESGGFRVELEVEGPRPVEILARQLERLFEVRRVEVLP